MYDIPYQPLFVFLMSTNNLKLFPTFIHFLRTHSLGIVISCMVGALAMALATRYQAPVMLFAMLSGLVFHFLYSRAKFQPGINFSSKNLMRFAVALLGVRISFDEIISLGIAAPLIVVTAMALLMLCGVLLARLLKLPTVFGVLSGGSVAVCGASAAAAIATVLPKKQYEEKYFALTVIGVTTFGTFAMIFYPLLVSYLGLNDQLAGIFIGGAIHDVAQVVGAGYTVSEPAGDVATYIKLLRVALLLPIVVIIFFAFKSKEDQLEQGVTSFVPTFLIGFFILALLNNLGFIPENIAEMIKSLSGTLLVIALSAIGLKTSLRQIVSVGWKPVLLILTESLLLAVFILLGLYYFI
ncbi:YeiH family protein [Thalassotalea aquiviva]|uniref:YeiH family protein n=1 Tax=Thalassotalea aquiviva TaxID=3242415 RepID=UPI00352B5879